VTDFDKLYIGGEWVEPDGKATIEVISPHTEQVIGTVPDATPADMDRAVAAARRAFDDGPWPRMSPADRAEGLKRLSGALQARSQDIADLISSQNGSPKSWSLMGQVFSATMVLDAYATFASNYPWEATARSARRSWSAGRRSGSRRGSCRGTCRCSSPR
jgi:aldehyde dehydrogenase (NAD+)